MSSENLITVSFPGAGWPRAAEPLPLLSTDPLRLDADGTAWLIEGGSVDLFAVAAADGGATGPRHPLWSVQGGELLLAMPPVSGLAIIAVGRLDSTARPLGPADLAAFAPE